MATQEGVLSRLRQPEYTGETVFLADLAVARVLEQHYPG